MLNALALKLVAGVAALLLLVVLVQDRNRWKAKAASLTVQIAADRKTYESAQREAAEKNRALVARIKAEQDRITDEVSDDYEKELADLRRTLAVRLRGQNPSSGGAPRSPGAGVPGQTPGGADEASRVCIPTGQYVRGAETELQLDRLIDWVERQSQVR